MNNGKSFQILYKFFLLILLIAQFYTKTYKYLPYGEILKTFENLEKTCPYIKLDTSQSRYNLPHPGYCDGEPCKSLIVFMTDFSTMAIEKPQIYLSGLLHGDEVIGATTLTELALYFCDNSQNNNEPWVKELLKRRLFILTPFTNAYGYANKIRDDYVLKNDNKTYKFDPNRDFPYFKGNYNDSDKCMQTVSARTVNELFREHLFIQAITFHGGLNAIGYGWGNYVHQKGKTSKPCPDCIGSKAIGEIMQWYSSSKINKKIIPDYTLGDMVEMSYPIDGGMEDWAYSASWENSATPDKPIKNCVPLTFGGYPREKTIYDDASIRCLIYIVETSLFKKPPEDQLGTDENLFNKSKFF